MWKKGWRIRVKCHLRHSSALQAGLEAMGLTLHVQEGHRLSSLTTVRIPDEVDELKIRQRLLNEYNIEIGAGLGPLKGKIWRIGLMGYSSTAENVIIVLSTLEKLLSDENYRVPTGSGVAAAIEVLTRRSLV